ncbi:MAG: putative amino acid racemase [Aeromicrobium sp.]|jgi:predicted amino acid racemase|nr:putative amino acid racemase [Aeromicrobium sp.]
MFLSTLRRRNPQLLEAAIALHQRGDVPANTTVLDLDAIERNSRSLSSTAAGLRLRPFAMTKQIGRNPDAIAAIQAGGIDAAVAVDLECALAVAAGGMRIGHLGHLVQIPRARADEGAALAPDYWTVFSFDKAREVAEAAKRTGRPQRVLARIFADGDRFYRGHEGGFAAADIVRVADALDAIDGIEFAGITSFPTMLLDPDTRRVLPTPNLATLRTARSALERAGRTHVEMNTPGTTSSSILAELAAAGATQIEPGHGLTGTTPLHAFEDLVEEPAIAYVSEVSHVHNGDAYVFGGGLYVDPVLDGTPTRALLVPRGGGLDDACELPVDMPAPGAIDYYAVLPQPPVPVAAGDTVVFGFRPQVFVSRSLTVGISGAGTEPRAGRAWGSNGAPAITIHDARTGWEGHR